MKKLSVACIVLLIVASCSQVLITDRKQFSLISDSELLNMSLQSYQQFIDSVPLSTDMVHTEMVKKLAT